MKRRVNRQLDALGNANSFDDYDDSSQSSSHISKTPSLLATTNPEDNERRLQIIAREERHVRKARCAVASAMVVCAVALSVAVYTFAARAEYQNFQLEVTKSVMSRVIVDRIVGSTLALSTLSHTRARFSYF
jgi:hypothetical protein